MIIFAYRKIREFAEVYPESKASLDAWFTTTENADWANFAQLKASFNSADIYKDCVIFDVGGNKFRLIGIVHYKTRTVLIRNILTHADYDKDKWKPDCCKD